MSKKPDPADSELRKAERREAEARAHLERCGGVGGEVMQALGRYFVLYAEKPRPDLFVDTIARIDDLKLMLLPEHRHGVAGAIAAIYSLHPERQDQWRLEMADRPHLLKILEAAERLAPPLADEAITTSSVIDYLWMSWLITRDPSPMRRVVSLAQRFDEVGETALALLHLNAERAEVQGELMGILKKREQRAAPYRGVVPPSVPVQDVSELRALLTPNALMIRQVVLVGWLPGEDGGFLVVTIDGTRPPGCPAQWRQRPVKVRRAKPDELRMHRELLAQAEEP